MTTTANPIHVSKTDNEDIRLIVVVPWRVQGAWSLWKERFAGRKTLPRDRCSPRRHAPRKPPQGPPVVFGAGPVPVTGDTQNGPKEYESDRYLHDAVAARLLSPENRCHAVYPEPDVVYQTDRARESCGRTPYRVIAADILFMEQNTVPQAQPRSGAADGARRGPKDDETGLLIALHITTTALRSPDVAGDEEPVTVWQVQRLVRDPAGQKEINHVIIRMLGAAAGAVPLDAAEPAVVGSADGVPYHIVYVPQWAVAAQDARNLVVDPGSALADVLAAPPEPRTHPDRQVVAAWLWATLPRQGDETLEGDAISRYEARFHHLSQSWSAYASHNGCAFVRTSKDNFHPLVHIEGFFIEAVLLALLQRYRADSLTTRLAGQASQVGPAYLDQAIALDSEAVDFVVRDQWTSAGRHHQFDVFYAYLVDVMRVTVLVNEAREQAHMLRENTQVRIGRREEQAEARRAESSRVIEQALAILTFVGLPLTVMMEIWVNWDSAHGLGDRTWRSWAWLVVVVVVSVVLGWTVARRGFGVGLRRLGCRRTHRLSADPTGIPAVSVDNRRVG